MATQALQKFNSTAAIPTWPNAAGIGVVDGQPYVNADGTPVALGGVVGKVTAYPATSTGVNTLVAAATVARVVQLSILVTAVFANGTGAQPTFKIGYTGSDAAFMATSVLTNAAAGTIFTFAGTVPADAALIVTATAATGTATGAIQVTAILTPSL